MIEVCCDCAKEGNNIESEYQCRICGLYFCETHFMEHIGDEHWKEFVITFDKSFTLDKRRSK